MAIQGIEEGGPESFIISGGRTYGGGWGLPTHVIYCQGRLTLNANHTVVHYIQLSFVSSQIELTKYNFMPNLNEVRIIM